MTDERDLQNPATSPDAERQGSRPPAIVVRQLRADLRDAKNQVREVTTKLDDVSTKLADAEAKLENAKQAIGHQQQLLALKDRKIMSLTAQIDALTPAPEMTLAKLGEGIFHSPPTKSDTTPFLGLLSGLVNYTDPGKR